MRYSPAENALFAALTLLLHAGCLVCDWCLAAHERVARWRRSRRTCNGHR